MHIPEISLHKHYFVVTQKTVDVSSVKRSLLFQRYQKIHYRPGIRAPVEDITYLNKVRLAPCPVHAVIHQTGSFQYLYKLTVVTVYIPNSHNTTYTVPA